MLDLQPSADPEGPIPDPDAQSPYATCRRRLVMRVMRQLILQVNPSRKYKVRRGGIDWSAWNFETHPWPVCLTCDESSFLAPPLKNRAAISLEMMTRMAPGVEEIDEELLDSLVIDAGTVFKQIDVAEDPTPVTRGRKNKVLGFVEQHTSTVIEVSNADWKIQGVIATAFVNF